MLFSAIHTRGERTYTKGQILLAWVGIGVAIAMLVCGYRWLTADPYLSPEPGPIPPGESAMFEVHAHGLMYGSPTIVGATGAYRVKRSNVNADPCEDFIPTGQVPSYNARNPTRTLSIPGEKFWEDGAIVTIVACEAGIGVISLVHAGTAQTRRTYRFGPATPDWPPFTAVYQVGGENREIEWHAEDRWRVTIPGNTDSNDVTPPSRKEQLENSYREYDAADDSRYHNTIYDELYAVPEVPLSPVFAGVHNLVGRTDGAPVSFDARVCDASTCNGPPVSALRFEDVGGIITTDDRWRLPLQYGNFMVAELHINPTTTDKPARDFGE